MPAVIEMHNVYKSYVLGENKVSVLNGVSLTVEAGEFVAILGPSGSGKTTLMNIVGLIDTMDDGYYCLDGVDIAKQADSTYARLRNQKIGFVFQKFNLISKYTALYNVAIPLLVRGETYASAKKKRLKRLGMWGSRGGRTTAPTSFRADSSSAWPSRARSWAIAR